MDNDGSNAITWKDFVLFTRKKAPQQLVPSDQIQVFSKEFNNLDPARKVRMGRGELFLRMRDAVVLVTRNVRVIRIITFHKDHHIRVIRVVRAIRVISDGFEVCCVVLWYVV